MAASFASSLLKQQQLRAASAVAKGGDEKGGDASANASANASVNASAGATSSGDSTAAPSLGTRAFLGKHVCHDCVPIRLHLAYASHCCHS